MMKAQMILEPVAVMFQWCNQMSHQHLRSYGDGATANKVSSSGLKNPLVRSYLRVPQAAGQVKLWMIPM